ncbi:MAG: TRAP transporter substrate-binding protein [Gammaproteobacteria bacterium]|nr:TRAP transporter substrate-binding protein [Gammaproteobacteria bacterium]
MKRRKFLTGLATTSAIATAALPATSAGAEPRVLKMVTSWPKNLPGLGTSADRLAKTITATSGGRLQVEVYGAGELVDAFEVFDAVSAGVADMYHSAEYYWQKKSPAFSFFTAVPFGLTASELNSWIYDSGGQALWDELSAGFNLKAMLCCNTGVQMGGWFNKEVSSLESYEGLRYRMPGLGGEVLRRLGAVVVNLPGGEIVPSLQSGAIDASEWVGPWNDFALGMHEAAKYYYYPGFHEPGTAICLGVNKKLWEEMSDDERNVIETSAAAENVRSVSEFNSKNAAYLQTIIKEHGIELRKFDDSVLEAIGTISGQVLAEIGQSDPMTKRVYDSYLQFRGSAIQWSNISERGFLNARSLDYDYGASG